MEADTVQNEKRPILLADLLHRFEVAPYSRYTTQSLPKSVSWAEDNITSS